MMTWRLLAFTLLLPGLAMADTAAEWTKKGDELRAKNDFPTAIAAYSQALEKDPNSVVALLGRATARERTGDFAAAIADDTKAISLAPKNPVAYTNRGNARAAQGDLSGAESDYTQALKLDPKHVHAWINRGNVRVLQKKYADAISDYTTAIGLDPKNGSAYFDRANAEKMQLNLTAAQADYSQAIKLNVTDVHALINRAVLRLAAKDYLNARIDLLQAMRLLPKDRQVYPRLYIWLADTRLGKAPQAQVDLAQYLGQSGASQNTWGWRAAAYLDNRISESDFLASAADFEKQKKRGEIAQSYFYVGLKHQADRGPEAGKEWFQKCIDAGDPSIHEYLLARAELKPARETKP
jgi:tetratricopeptide (TPR) repeat protein